MLRWFMLIPSFLLVMSLPASATPILGLLPSTQSTAEDSIVPIAFTITGLADPPSLGTFDLSITFDPTVLSFVAFDFGDPVLGDQLDPTGGGNTIAFTNAGIGAVELFELSLDSTSVLNSLQQPDFRLGVATFQTVRSGTSPLDLTIIALGDADGNNLPANVQCGSINVTAAVGITPEPSTCVEVLTGLIFVSIAFGFKCRGKLSASE